MKTVWIKYFSLLTGILLFMGCKDHSGKATPAEIAPVFQEDPNVKSITALIHNSPGNAGLYFERGGMLHKLKEDTLALKD